jgi:hypothetical protein
MSKQNTSISLDRIVSALEGTAIGSATIAEIIADVERQIAATEQSLIEEKESVLDLTKCKNPKAAHDRIVELELFLNQLRASRPRLDEKLAASLESERSARFDGTYKQVKAERDRLANEFAEVYQATVARLVDVLIRMAACDVKCAEVNSQASALHNEQRRLLKCELVARGLEAFSRAQPELAKTVVLPDFVESARTRWPATTSTSFAVAYAETTSPPFHAGADWASSAEKQRRRQAIEADQARSAAFHEQATKDQEERKNREERERFAALKR